MAPLCRVLALQRRVSHPEGPWRGARSPAGGSTMQSADRQWLELGRIIGEYSLLEDTGVPAYRCFLSEYYRDPMFDSALAATLPRHGALRATLTDALASAIRRPPGVGALTPTGPDTTLCQPAGCVDDGGASGCQPTSTRIRETVRGSTRGAVSQCARKTVSCERSSQTHY